MTISYPSPLPILQHKREADLSDGAFVRYTPIAPSERSRFSPTDPTARVELGLGYVQAVLAALHGVVQSFTYDPPGICGWVTMRSSGSSATYHFSWHDDGRFLLGGFRHSGGQPTYQAALVALVQAIAQARCGVTDATAELVARWAALVQAQEHAFPRHDPNVGWDRHAVAHAGIHPDVRPHILRVCDALRVALTYRLPDCLSRAAAVTADDVIVRAVGASIIVPGALLLHPGGIVPDIPVPGEPPTPVPVAPPEPDTPTVWARKRTARKKSTPGTSPAPSNTSTATPRLFGPHLARIERALARGGPVLLVGPTATGKTTQALAAAASLGFGVEAITLNAGWEAEDLFGSFTRTANTADWIFVPGPITRWAERAVAGEAVVLLIDELARGHPTVISAVMRLMNPYPRTALAGMHLPIPDGEDGPFHIVDIRATQQRLVVPCRRVRIVATANQGEHYAGLDLADPAFGRRWIGGWLQLTGYQPDDEAQILADRLGLHPAAPLVRAMQQVAREVLAYQQKEAALRAVLDLGTLLAWGTTTLQLYAHAAPGTATAVAQTFIDAARDTWLDRLCPLQGADLDPQVERTLLGFVTAAATTLS
jgi:hypothetical protein